jgi:hypothetical protein
MAYPSVTFQPTTQVIGTQAIGTTSTTKQHELGTVISATDITYGAGEFIYLKGVASTAKGDVVCFDQNAGTTVRALAGDAGSTGLVAVAMSANVASQYGWYAVGGSVPANAATALANTQAHLSASAGQIDDATGTPITGMLIKAATSAGFATVQINRPSVSPESSGSNSGDVSLASVGSTPAAAGASLSGQVLTLQPADGTHPGLLTTGSQTIAGNKTFSGTDFECQYLTAANQIRAAQGFYNANLSQPCFIRAAPSDGAGAVLGVTDGDNTLTVSGAKLHSFRNRAVEKAFVDKDGNFETPIVGSGFILKSPDGTRYKIAVANDGTLSASAA